MASIRCSNNATDTFNHGAASVSPAESSARPTLPVPVAVALVSVKERNHGSSRFEEKSSSARAVFRADASFAYEGASEPEKVRCHP